MADFSRMFPDRPKRNVPQLKDFWKHKKVNARKVFAEKKREVKRTGGGVCSIDTDDPEMSLLYDAVQGDLQCLENPFDNDGDCDLDAETAIGGTNIFSDISNDNEDLIEGALVMFKEKDITNKDFCKENQMPKVQSSKLLSGEAKVPHGNKKEHQVLAKTGYAEVIHNRQMALLKLKDTLLREKHSASMEVLQKKKLYYERLLLALPNQARQPLVVNNMTPPALAVHNDCLPRFINSYCKPENALQNVSSQFFNDNRYHTYFPI